MMMNFAACGICIIAINAKEIKLPFCKKKKKKTKQK